jgi:ELWxxDGT repeat protein
LAWPPSTWQAVRSSTWSLVVDLRPEAASSAPDRRLGWELAAVGPRVYFGATDGERGVELWTSDGTEEGTRLVQDINPGPGSSSPDGFVVAGDCLYFGANDGEHGFELWAMPLRPSISSLPDPRCGTGVDPSVGVSSGGNRGLGASARSSGRSSRTSREREATRPGRGLASTQLPRLSSPEPHLGQTAGWPPGPELAAVAPRCACSER